MTDGILTRLVARNDLTSPEVRTLVTTLVDPTTDDVLRAALLVALRSKGETEDELGAFAREIRRRSSAFSVPRSDGAVDLCGSGGAPTPSFNFGTVSAFVVRAAGVPVAKHGNRSARGATSGYAGSSDLLEALGLPVTESVEFARESYRRFGLAFLHAPLYHSATAAVAPVRRSLGIPTVFNQLGPLTNPAHVPYQVVGCPTVSVAERSARVLSSLGVLAGVAVTGAEGVDEFSPQGKSECVAWSRDRRTKRTVRPQDFLEVDERRGPWTPLPAARAAEETQRLLAGGDGARRGGVLLTSGAALWISGRAPDLRAGVEHAREALDSGSAEALLRALQSLAQERAWPTEG